MTLFASASEHHTLSRQPLARSDNLQPRTMTAIKFFAAVWVILMGRREVVRKISNNINGLTPNKRTGRALTDARLHTYIHLCIFVLLYSGGSSC